MCSCFCCAKKKGEDEESLYTETEPDEEPGDDVINADIPMNGKDPDEDLEDHNDGEVYSDHDVPEIVITESSFTREKSKRKRLSQLLKKVKKPMSKVRFAPGTTSEKTSLTNSHDLDYGSTSLAPLQRTDSMESFMSSMSTATTMVEEFGEELSPSRIQVFIQYDPKSWTLTVGCKQAECLVSTKKDAIYWQAHMTLLPFKKHRFKTKYKSSSTPVFNQNFEIENIAQQALTQLSVRYRIYGRPGRTGRKKLAGETEVELSHISQLEDKIIKDWRVLRRKNTSGSLRVATPTKMESDV